MPNLLQGGRGRPLHPMLVHFPVALYPTSLVFDVLSHLADDGNPFVRGAFTLIVIALVVSALAVAAGFADFLLIENGTRTWRSSSASTARAAGARPGTSRCRASARRWSRC